VLMYWEQVQQANLSLAHISANSNRLRTVRVSDSDRQFVHEHTSRFQFHKERSGCDHRHIQCESNIYVMGANKSKLVSIPKSDLDSLEATLETPENEYVIDQLERSEQDIIKGRVRNVRDFLGDL
jgi:hypothetical protein